METLRSDRRERIMAPLDLDEEKTLRFYVGASFHDVTFSSSFAWYLHRFSTGAWPGLYGRLESEVFLNLGETIEVLPAAPLLSPLREGAGIEILGDVSIDWDNSTIDPRFFGWPASASGIAAAAGGSLRSPLSRYGDWLPMRGAWSYDRDRESHIRAASTLDVGATAYQQVDLGETVRRLIRWEYEPAASVLNTLDSGLLEVAGFDEDDTHMNFENVWELGLRSRRDCLIQYADAAETLNIVKVPNQRETVRLDANVNRMRQVIKRMNVVGERYTIELPVVVRDSAWPTWGY